MDKNLKKALTYMFLSVIGFISGMYILYKINEYIDQDFQFKKAALNSALENIEKNSQDTK